MKNPILHLNLKRKWFDMIKAGHKTEEYRELSGYWKSRFPKYSMYCIFFHMVKIKGVVYKPHDVTICFSNGYAKDREQIYVKIAEIRIGSGKKKWGAKRNKSYFVIKLEK